MSRTSAEVSKPRRRVTRSDLPGPRRRETPAANPSLTMDDLRKKPGMLVGVADLVSMAIVPSYMALRRQRIAGVFPKPKTLPSRLLAWEARQITDWYDALPSVDPVA